MPQPANDEFRRAMTEHADELARRERAAEAELARMRATIERLRRERESRLAEFRALTPPADAAQIPAAANPAADEAEPASVPTDTRTHAPGVAAIANAADILVAEPAPAAEAPDGRPQAAAPEVALRLGELPYEASPEDLDAFQSELVLTPQEPQLPPPSDTSSAGMPAAEPRTERSFALVLVSAALAGLALGAYGVWNSNRAAAPARPPAAAARPRPAAAAAASAPASPASPDIAPAAAPSAQAPASAPASTAAPRPSLRVDLVVSRPAWIRAVVDDQATVNRTVPAGERIALAATRFVEIRTGDAGAVRVFVDGEDRGVAGRNGQVLTTRLAAVGTRTPRE